MQGTVKHKAEDSCCLLFLLAIYLNSSSTLKMEAVFSFKTSVQFYQTTWHFIQENSIIQPLEEFSARRKIKLETTSPL
jgi:hypothetical protein